MESSSKRALAVGAEKMREETTRERIETLAADFFILVLGTPRPYQRYFLRQFLQKY